jgi:hypothetical protein
MQEWSLENESYLSISLFKFLKKFMVKEENDAFSLKIKLLNENESFILSLIRKGKAKEITIQFKDQAPTYIKVTRDQKIFAESRVSDAILGKGYQEISIKTQDGNISCANIVTKHKLK